MIWAEAAFIAQGPYNDGGVVFVDLGHAPRALQEAFCPFRVIGQHGATAVRLDVGFAYDHETVFVAQLVKIGVVRIMAGAHGIDVHLLHEHHFALHFLPGHIVSGRNAVLVAVDAANDGACAVDF